MTYKAKFYGVPCTINDSGEVKTSNKFYDLLMQFFIGWHTTKVFLLQLFYGIQGKEFTDINFKFEVLDEK